MTELEASAHSVDHLQLYVGIFQRDENWVQVFTTKSNEFYTNHLMWFYKPKFDAEKAYALTNSLMKNGKDTSGPANKRKKS